MDSWWCKSSDSGREASGTDATDDDFSVHQCTCLCDDDRPIAYRNIVLLMKATGQVVADFTDEVALDVFNMTLKECLPVALISSVGCGLRYCHFFAWMRV